MHYDLNKGALAISLVLLRGQQNKLEDQGQTGYFTDLPGFLGENINICWSPDGQTIAVGNKDDVVTFIDAKTHRSKAEEQFKFEVNEISWNNDNNMFFLTNGNGCINILR